MKANIHERAKACAKTFSNAKRDLIKVLIEVDQNRSFEDHMFTHLTPYCVKFLNIDPDIAKTLVRIIRKSIDVPELAEAVLQGKIHISNAKVICSVLTPENHKEWIQKAHTLSKAKLEREVADSGGPNTKRVSLVLSLETLELLKRASELLSTKEAKLVSQEQTIEQALREYVFKHDPVEKAKRSKCPQDSQSPTAIKHQVNDRDDNQCVFICNISK